MRLLLPIIVCAVMAPIAAPASAQEGLTAWVYQPCATSGDASIVAVAGALCPEAEAAAAQVVAVPAAQEADALVAAGWRPVRASSTDDEREHDLMASRGSAALRIRRPGPAPDIDGWEAGRELIFARGRLVGGGRVPSGAVACTSAFLVQLPSGSQGGLSAAHCGGLRRDGTVRRRNVALRRPPQNGLILGRVQRILTRRLPLDALLVPAPGAGSARTRVPVVNRGITRPPWSVVGVAQPTSGRQVCFSGRTSGVDQCGEIVSSRARAGERLISGLAGVLVRCTTIRALPGDSGGPLFTAPSAGGRVRAVGIVTLILVDNRQMCFTPLGPVLRGLGATLVTTSG